MNDALPPFLHRRIHSVDRGMLILAHRNHKALLPINHLRLDLRCLLRLHTQYHIIGLCLRDIIVDLFLLFNELEVRSASASSFSLSCTVSVPT